MPRQITPTAIKVVVALAAITTLILAAPIGARSTKASWTEFQAEQRLTVGRFAANNGVKFATCLGTGPATGPSHSRRFKHLECKLQDKGFERERQIVVHVRGETKMFVQWLTTKECGDA